MNPIDRLPQRLAADLDAAFGDLVSEIHDGLYSGVLRLTGSPSEAQDITQEALIRAYQALSGYTPNRIREMRLRPWVWTIAANLCRNRARRARRTPQQPLGDLDPATDAPGPEAAALRADARERLAALVVELPWAMRAAVVLRHVTGLGYSEIAEALDRPVGTVKADVHRGLARLREALTREEA